MNICLNQKECCVREDPFPRGQSEPFSPTWLQICRIIRLVYAQRDAEGLNPVAVHLMVDLQVDFYARLSLRPHETFEYQMEKFPGWVEMKHSRSLRRLLKCESKLGKRMYKNAVTYRSVINILTRRLFFSNSRRDKPLIFVDPSQTNSSPLAYCLWSLWGKGGKSPWQLKNSTWCSKLIWWCAFLFPTGHKIDGWRRSWRVTLLPIM